MKSISKSFIIFGLALVLSGCGQKHKAKSVIVSFIEENTTLADMNRSFDRLDSTYRLTDSIIVSMQQHARQLPQLKKNVSFGKRPKGEALLYQRVKFCNESDTIRMTFYMDRAMTNVVACKEN